MRTSTGTGAALRAVAVRAHDGHQPDRDRAAMVQQRRQMAADQGDEAVAGVLAQLLGRQPGEGALRLRVRC